MLRSALQRSWTAHETPGGTIAAKIRGVLVFASAAFLANYAYACLVFWALGKAESFLKNSGRIEGALFVALVFWMPSLGSFSFFGPRFAKILSDWPKETRDTIVVAVSGAAPFAAFAIYLMRNFLVCLHGVANGCLN
jgi:hypothetical protein